MFILTNACQTYYKKPFLYTYMHAWSGPIIWYDVHINFLSLGEFNVTNIIMFLWISAIKQEHDVLFGVDLMIYPGKILVEFEESFLRNSDPFTNWVQPSKDIVKLFQKSLDCNCSLRNGKIVRAFDTTLKILDGFQESFLRHKSIQEHSGIVLIVE